jgi:uncharacterized protein YndB with AHSA1/START domain
VSEPEPPAAIVRRVIPAPPEVVYDEWLDIEALTEWMCPRPARATKIELDPRVGGRFHIDVEDGGLLLYIEGEYVDLDRPHRLRFTWTCSVWPAAARDSVVTVTLEAHGDKQTLMTIHHALLPPDLVAGHEDGWARIAEQLEESFRARL